MVAGGSELGLLLLDLGKRLAATGCVGTVMTGLQYPLLAEVHGFGTQFFIAGAAVRSVPASPDDEMLRALDRAVRHSVPKPTAVM